MRLCRCIRVKLGNNLTLTAVLLWLLTRLNVPGCITVSSNIGLRCCSAQCDALRLAGKRAETWS